MKRTPSENTYIPHQFTINAMDNLGRRTTTEFTRAKSALRIKKNNSGLPNFARKGLKAYDKENLLEQMRKEKRKQTEMSESNGKLKRMLTTSKGKKHRVRRRNTQLNDSVCQDDQNGQPNTLAVTLRRQMEQILGVIERQQEEIAAVKKSKKYTKYKELETIKETYQEQLAELRERIRLVRTVQREQRRTFNQTRAQKAGVTQMNRQVCCEYAMQNAQMEQKVQEVTEELEKSKIKGLVLRRERDRLLKDINQLQGKTGAAYIKIRDPSERQQESQQHRQSPQSELARQQEENEFLNDQEYYGQESEMRVTDKFRDSEFASNNRQEGSLSF